MTEITSRLSTALADRYKIERHLGEGGMASVYLAEDLKHKRNVALKVLKPDLAAVLGAERFIQEITTTASLQHPHILPLFDSGEADGFLYYVMPYIEGETLRDKLDRETQLGIDESVEIACNVADALDYAHRKGVIHRDIKPENILLHDGRPVVADFGIALAVSAAAGGRMTETGLSLGTPHYMSPEQATAEKDLSARSDVYSLASVLYEMLTGEPPHMGNSAQQIVMKILTDQARPVTELRKSVPPHVAAATARALEKLPADRFDSAAKFGEALTDPTFTVATTAPSAPATSVTRPRNTPLLALAGLAGVMTVLAAWGWFRPSSEIMRPVIRYDMPLDLLTTGQGQFGPSMALSPDGSKLVYVGTSDERTTPQLWIRRRDQLEMTPVPGTEGAHQPFFAPDGEHVGYISTTERAIRVVSLGGAPPLQIVDDGAFRLGGAWSPDGYVYFSRQPDGGLSRVPSGGGEIEQLSTPDTEKGETRHAWPSVLPGGRGVLVTVQRGSNAVSEEDDIGVLDLTTGEVTVLVRGLLARYAPTGHIVFVRFDGAVMAVPFDENTLEITGSAVPLFGGVAAGVRGPDFALSESGRLIYVTGGVAALTEGELVWIDRAGQVSRVEEGWTMTPNLAGGPALSPDGTRIAMSVVGSDGSHIWVKSLDDGAFQRLTFDASPNTRPRWTPDGQSVLYIAADGPSTDAHQKRADGSGTAEVLLDSEQPLLEARMSSDGQLVIARDQNADVVLGRVDDPTSLDTLLAGEEFYVGPTFSPDGRWLAYASTESGETEVYVKPFPNLDDGQWLISSDGGAEPVWSRNTPELFYKNGEQLVAVRYSTEPTFRKESEQVLFTLPFGSTFTNTATYDVSPDGRRFLMFSFPNALAATSPELIIVENFLEELKQKVGN